MISLFTNIVPAQVTCNTGIFLKHSRRDTDVQWRFVLVLLESEVGVRGNNGWIQSDG